MNDKVSVCVHAGVPTLITLLKKALKYVGCEHDHCYICGWHNPKYCPRTIETTLYQDILNVLKEKEKEK